MITNKYRTVAAVVLVLVLISAVGLLLRRRRAANTTVATIGGICQTCVIEVEKIATIGDREGAGALSRPFAVVHGAASTYVVPQPYAIVRFRDDGTFLSRLEKRGSGPGEFQGVSAIVFSNDNLHIIDERNLRYSVLSSDMHLIREASLRGIRPLALGLVVTSSGRTILNGIASGAGFNRPVLHEFDSLGVRVSSFDSVNIVQERKRGLPNADSRILAPSRHDRVWVGRGDDYDLSLWDLDPPRRLLRLRPRPSWFALAQQSGTSIKPGTPESPIRKAPPPPALLGIQEDSLGMVWVIGRTTNRDWKRYSDSREGRTLKMYSGVIDVIDPSNSSSILASVQVPFIGRFVGPQIIGTYHESPEGYPSIELYRVHLRGYPPQPTRRN